MSIQYSIDLHIHSTVSDGSWTPEQLKEEYSKRGYSIIAYTDHGKLITHNELTDARFLALNGLEIGLEPGSRLLPLASPKRAKVMASKRVVLPAPVSPVIR